MNHNKDFGKYSIEVGVYSVTVKLNSPQETFSEPEFRLYIKRCIDAEKVLEAQINQSQSINGGAA